MDTAKKLIDYQQRHLLFHGSLSDGLQELELRAAHDKTPGREFNNDNALFATPYAAIAVAFACTNTDLITAKDKKLYRANYGIYFRDNTPQLHVPLYFEKYFGKFEGTVYVINKIGPLDAAWQVKLFESVRPLDALRVTMDDFFALGGQVVWRDNTPK